MIRARPSAILLPLLIGLSAWLVPARPSLAQPAPSASAKAGKAAKTAKENTADAGAPSGDAGIGGDAGARANDTEGLPSGHPPVGDTAPPSPNSKNTKNVPPGHEAMFSEPPEDEAVEDPGLPAGTLVVQIKDGADKPLPNLPVRVHILKSSVAKGDTERELTKLSDESGQFRLDGLELGSGISYSISASRGPAASA